MPSFRVIRTGHVVEIYQYEKAFFVDHESKDDDYEKIEMDRSKENAERSKQRSREMIKRLALVNFGDGDTFMTLTFAENMTDVKKANNELKKFLQKMKRRQEDFKYLAVIEFQKRGAVHYHMICNWRYEESAEKEEEVFIAEKIWKHGFVDLRTIRDNDNVGAYIVKYMTKEKAMDERLFNQKTYFHNRSLVSPKEIKDPEEIMKIVNTFEGHIPSYTNDYSSIFTGGVKYREYNLKRMGLL